MPSSSSSKIVLRYISVVSIRSVTLRRPLVAICPRAGISGHRWPSQEITARLGHDGCMTTSVLWFRRDLRLADHLALQAAVESGADVVPLFVVDPALWEPAGQPRRGYLVASLAALTERIGGLVVRTGAPVTVVAALAEEVGARDVFV